MAHRRKGRVVRKTKTGARGSLIEQSGNHLAWYVKQKHDRSPDGTRAKRRKG